MENIIRFHAWEGEQSIRMMRATSLSSGYNIETFVIIIDAAHWHLGLCTKEALTFIQGMASIDSDHYPERLGALVVINAPSVLSIAYRVIAALLDDVQRKKIQILTHKNDWFPVLLELMDEDQIPLQYGGTYPDPDPGTPYSILYFMAGITTVSRVCL